jgi:TonB family protein
MKLLAIAVLVAASLIPVAAQEVYKPGNGVSLPTVVSEVKPDYTDEAKRARIQGNVILDAVVNSDGSVTDVKVARSLDDTFGLDKQAVNAAKQWKFKPGMKDGKAVAVRVMIEMTFTLK